MIYDFAVSTRRGPGIASQSEPWVVVGSKKTAAMGVPWLTRAARELLDASPDANAVAVFATRNGRHLGKLVVEVYRDSTTTA